jgi:hypothetical protein
MRKPINDALQTFLVNVRMTRDAVEAEVLEQIADDVVNCSVAVSTDTTLGVGFLLRARFKLANLKRFDQQLIDITLATKQMISR